MTRERLCRLIELSALVPSGCLSDKGFAELAALQARFAAWSPLTPERMSALLLEAETVGYLRREWREAEERWEETGRHPYYRCKADSEKSAYVEARVELWAKAGIPVPEEIE